MLKKIKTEDFRSLLPDREIGDLFKNGGSTTKDFAAYSEIVGPFTVVVISVAKGMFSGVSKRNPDDKPSDLTGLRVAAVRAWRSMWGDYEGYCRKRPVTNRQRKMAFAFNLVDKLLNQD
jgi:hypothetical protein